MSRCFAYSKKGERCEQEAGHDGLHTVSVSWSDEDVWTPLATTMPPGVPPLVIKTGPRKCVICEHPWHGDSKCGVAEGDGFECECSVAVE